MGDDGNSGFDSGVDYGGGTAGSDGLSGLSGGGLSDGSFSGDIGYGGGSDFSGGGFESGVDFGISPYSDFSFGGQALGSNIDSSIADQGWGLSNYGNFGQEEDTFGRIMNNPALRGLMTVLGIAKPGNPVSSMFSMARNANNIGFDKSGKAAAGFFGGTLGSVVGNMAAPGIGGVVGGMLGSHLGSQGSLPGYSGPTAGQPSGAQGGDFMDKVIPTLAGLYAGYQGGKGINKQIGTLSGMYGQGSPYAQALRQQLERRDAAGGRRSQYGPREVELQAQLARMASGNAPGLAALYGQQNANRAAMLKALMFGYDQMGGLRGIQGGLQGLFGEEDPTRFAAYDTSGIGIGPESANYSDAAMPDWGG